MDYTTQPIAELTNGIIIEEYVKVDRYNSDIYQTESEMEKKLISDLVSGQQYTFFDGKTPLRPVFTRVRDTLKIGKPFPEK